MITTLRAVFANLSAARRRHYDLPNATALTGSFSFFCARVVSATLSGGFLVPVVVATTKPLQATAVIADLLCVHGVSVVVVTNVFTFYARQHICYSAYMP